MPLLVEALDALPKVELHCHVEGTMRPQTVVELARANAVRLPTGAAPREGETTSLRHLEAMGLLGLRHPCA